MIPIAELHVSPSIWIFSLLFILQTQFYLAPIQLETKVNCSYVYESNLLTGKLSGYEEELSALLFYW